MSKDHNEDTDSSLFKRVLRGKIGGEREEITSAGLTASMALLREWQVTRLTETYADLLASKRYGRACQFFLTDIYGTKDFSQRDADAENVYNAMKKYLPDRLLFTMGRAVELNKLTKQLDEHLLTVLVEEVGMTDSLSAEQYVSAYRLCDNYDARQTQIDLILEIGQGVDNLVKIPMIGMILRAARRPANRSGWAELHDFLERGFASFKNMKGGDQFFKLIAQRERQILDNIFEGKDDPLIWKR